MWENGRTPDRNGVRVRRSLWRGKVRAFLAVLSLSCWQGPWKEMPTGNLKLKLMLRPRNKEWGEVVWGKLKLWDWKDPQTQTLEG